jgi:hypothetical protein
MLLDAATAKALFAIVMISTSGGDSLKQEFPLQVEDRDDAWLVKGSEHSSSLGDHIMTHMFFSKDKAEVSGIRTDARFKTTPAKKAYWLQYMSEEDYQRVFGAPTHFEPDGVPDIYFALYGGLINKPADAVDYAYVLMQTKPAFAAIKKIDLKATEIDTERDKVWHVTQHRADGADTELLSFSRKTGKLLSGDL